ncbi:hypothetical protein FV217_07305 [Methylobacterium sp. WL9]|nr:hypothetical protein FV217_07305 [Methylobacterium sp. WL9]
MSAGPSPLCGRGWPSRQRGSGEGSDRSGRGAPLSRPASRATLPAKGGGVGTVMEFRAKNLT